MGYVSTWLYYLGSIQQSGPVIQQHRLADSYKLNQNTKCLDSLFLLKSLLFTACKIALKFQPKFISAVSNVHSKYKKHGITSNGKVRSLSSSCQTVPTGSEAESQRNHEQWLSRMSSQVFSYFQYHSIPGDMVVQQINRFYHGKKKIDKAVAHNLRATLLFAKVCKTAKTGRKTQHRKGRIIFSQQNNPAASRNVTHNVNHCRAKDES